MRKIFENKYININDYEYRAVKSVLDSKQLSGMADVVIEYERRLAEYFGSKHALAVTNGTSAIEIALRAAGVQTGDEVITTPLGPVMTVLPILALGATPVFVDSESTKSFNISLDDLRRKITKKTKALISVPMWGYPNKLNEIKDICNENNIVLIEDASHCHGTKINNNYQGTFGDIGIFSTQERKLIGTGEGGFVLTNSDNFYLKIKELRNFGKPFRKEFIEKGWVDQYGYLFGLNYRLNAFASAIGIEQLKKLKEKIRGRTRNAKYYNKQLRLSNLTELPIIETGKPNYYSIVYLIDKKYSAENIGKRLDDCRIISDTYRFRYKPLYNMPIFKKFKVDCPNAEKLASTIITLPTHEGLNKADLKFIVKKLKQIISESG